jgi:hypothetical protein
MSRGDPACKIKEEVLVFLIEEEVLFVHGEEKVLSVHLEEEFCWFT